VNNDVVFLVGDNRLCQRNILPQIIANDTDKATVSKMLLNEVQKDTALPLAIAAKRIEQRCQKIEARLPALIFQHTRLIDLARTDELLAKAGDIRNGFLRLLKEREEASRKLRGRFRDDLRLFAGKSARLEPRDFV